jgi:succinate-semialdehyde dehydrogenase/glutarate-semialdehyde dehydrogenase
MQMLIDGKWVEASSRERMPVYNPATGELIDTVPMAEREDVKAAVDAAEESFKKWSATPAIERSRILLKIAENVKQNVEELARTLTLEQGKPLNESRSEVNSFANSCEYYAGLAGRHRNVHNKFSTGEGFFVVTKIPVGVVGAILPWNFPVSLLGWKVAPGLAAGNTFVVKPASSTPLTDIKIVDIMYRSGLPAGVVNLVTCPGSKVGEEIIKNPKVSKIAFTGETGTGKRIMEMAAEQIKRITLELGGSDPMIVFEDADIELAVEGAVWGRYRNCGQSCTSVKRLILVRSIAESFISKLVEKVKAIVVGNGLNPETNMGPLHNQQQREKIERMVEDAVANGAKVLVGGKRPEGKEFSQGYYYLPTVLTDVSQEALISNEEAFGPALPIYVVESEEEAVELANRTIYGLGSSVWTRDTERAFRVAEMIQAGTTWINSPPIARAEVPFGGFKQSGLGRELGIEGLEHYYETKSIQVYDYSNGRKWKFPI